MSENNFLVFTKKQTSFLTAGIIFLLTLAFTIGYIIGQRKAINDFSDQLKEDSFSDNVKYSLYSSYKSLPNNGDIDSEAELDLNEPEESKPEIKKELPQIKPNTIEKQEGIKTITEQKYYAQLFGCGNLMTAKKFVDRTRKLGVSTEIEEKKSKGKGGKVIKWYQIKTVAYHDKSKLLKDVEKIQLSEKLQKVKIVEE